MVSHVNPFGDARAADRVAEAVWRWGQGRKPLLEPEDEFAPALPSVA